MRSHRANKAHRAAVDAAMAAAGFELVPDLDRARELGRQVWMRRASPGCVLMVSTNDGRPYADPYQPHWQAFGVDGLGDRLQVRNVTLAAAILVSLDMERGELDRLDGVKHRPRQ